MLKMAHESAALRAVEGAIQSGRFDLPLSVFGEDALFELEQRRLFARTWNFVAHESEIPAAGDYVLRYIGRDPFLVVRGTDGETRVLYAACRHRGMQICRAESGSAKRFVCPYHGWTYGTDGALVGVPEASTAYGDFARGDWGLLPVARVDRRNGFIFASQRADVESLETFMGDYRWYFDFWTRRTEAGMEVRGAPQRFIVPANWKLGAENFFGDAYHTMTSHRSAIDSGFIAVGGNVSWRSEGVHYNASGVGGGGFSKLPATGGVDGYPPELNAALRRWMSPEHQAVLFERGLIPASGTMFPNLSFVSVAVAIDDGGEPVRFTSFRQWRPLSADKMEIMSWCAVEAEAPEEWKLRSERAYSASFGSSGMLEQDDTENWGYVTAVARGLAAETFPLNYRMGLTAQNEVMVAPLTDWPGPGSAYRVSYAEHNQRQFWSTWLAYLTGAR